MYCCRTSTACAIGLMHRSRLEPSTEEEIPLGISLSRLRTCNRSLSEQTSHVVAIPPLDYFRSFSQTRGPLRITSAGQLRNPMRIASDIAAALSAATRRSERPNGRLPVRAGGYWRVSSSFNRSEHGSRLKPE